VSHQLVASYQRMLCTHTYIVSLYHPWRLLSTYCPGDFTTFLLFFVPCSLYVPTQLFLIYSIPYKHASLQASFLHTPTSNFPSNSKSCCAGTPVSPLIPSRGHCPSAIVVKFFYLWNWTVLYYFIVLRVVPSISRCTQDTHTQSKKNYRYFHACPNSFFLATQIPLDTRGI
jgi:hypothetical protein